MYCQHIRLPNDGEWSIQANCNLRTGFSWDVFVNVRVVVLFVRCWAMVTATIACHLGLFLPLSHSYDHHRHSMKHHLPCWLPSCGYRHPPPPRVGLPPHHGSYCSPCISFRLSIQWWPLNNDHGRQFFSDDLWFKKSVRSYHYIKCVKCCYSNRFCIHGVIITLGIENFCRIILAIVKAKLVLSFFITVISNDLTRICSKLHLHSVIVRH